MPGAFVIKRKIRASVADLANSALKIYPLQRRRTMNCAWLIRAFWPQWHGPQRMLDVRENQLLVLLLMIQPHFDQGNRTLIRNFEMAQHCLIDVSAISMDFIQRWPRHQSTRAAIRMRSELLVVGIEKLLLSGIEWFVTVKVRAEDEGLKKPGGVCQVPLRGAGVRHGLEHQVFCRKKLGQLQASVANFPIPLAKGITG